MAKKQWKDLEIVKKTTKIYELVFKKDGIAQDITGWTVYFTLKKNMKDTDDNAKIKKTITTHSNAEGGKTLIELTTSDTNQDEGIYYYSIDYKDDDSNEDVLFTGRMKIIEPVLKTRT